MTPPLALELIDKAYEEKATFLDLGNCSLREIPGEIVKLAPFLRELNLGPYYYKNNDRLYSLNKGSYNVFSGIKVNFSILQKLNLTALYVSQTYISTECPLAISQLQSLTSLATSANRLTDSDADIIGKLQSLISLRISANQLTDRAAICISKLQNLRFLAIAVNRITDVGASYIAELHSLIVLEIYSNQLTDTGAAHIAKLPSLTSLRISKSQITDKGAAYIAQLNTITSLDISDNQLTNIGVLHITKKLYSLTSLSIANNQLTDVGAQYIINKFQSLTSLDIAGNNLTEKGIENLITLPRLTSISIDGNNVDTIPESIVNDLKALRDYFQAGELVDNNFVKVILMGNTTSGKSSLADYLTNEQYVEERESTHGIQLWKWKTDPKTPPNGLIVNIWDFGGQDYYHATHTLFMSEKALFLLLHTDSITHSKFSKETDQYLSEAYWLGNIKSLSGRDSQTWFIQSKYEPNDMAKPGELPVPRFFLAPTLAQGMVRNQFALSVKQAYDKDPAAVLNFVFFRQTLVAELRKLAKQQLPKSWVEIRDKHLPKWRKKGLYLTVNIFWKKCRTVFKSSLSLSKDFTKFPTGLLVYLNGCGEIVWFQHNPALADRIYLSVDQLSKKLFDILSLNRKDNQGVFTLSGLVNEDRREVEEYLKILLEFKLIFKAAGTSDTYIIPQYLPENPYTRHFQQLIQVAYVIRFTHYMPRSLVTRFLVQYGNTEGSYYWRYGAFFKWGTFHLFVQMDVNTQTVAIHISDGPTREKYTILQELFRFFTLPPQQETERLKNSPTRIEQTKRSELVTLSEEDKSVIQLSADGVEFATITELEKAIQNKITKVKNTEGNYSSIAPVMHQLLTNGAATPKKIFLSYAHKDEQYKKELDTHFSALKRSGLVETWQDREIMAGEDWDKVIKEAIKQSDIVLLMLSPDFMASDYIWNTELPTAKEHNTEIIPLFIRPCDFEETQFSLYKQQGLPGYENAQTRWVVSSAFPNRDEGYLQIVKGVREKLK